MSNSSNSGATSSKTILDAIRNQTPLVVTSTNEYGFVMTVSGSSLNLMVLWKDITAINLRAGMNRALAIEIVVDIPVAFSIFVSQDEAVWKALTTAISTKLNLIIGPATWAVKASRVRAISIFERTRSS